MTKFVSLLFIGLMAVQIIRPIGLPGLRQRRDFWKLAVAALAILMLVVLIRP